MKAPFEAVALEYGKQKTPRVVAKGQEELALRIITEAKRQGIYVAEDPQLLALLSRLDVGEEITQDMYTAVAVILSWVYWLKGMQPGDEAKAESEADQASKDDQASL
jgi:flagellar biosynthesis protein